MTEFTIFSYMYRDGDNYKYSGRSAFRGAITDDQMVRLENAFDDGCYFIADQININIPAVFPYPDPYEYNAGSGHCWHEFLDLSVKEVDEQMIDAIIDGRTIDAFVQDVETASKTGLKEYDPAPRESDL
ncbi:MAG: hypothetical protein PHR28_12110 [candidate division Zixibacteria bacterium]|jgi:hypothetical protein|nr:hypothetical protein [candidate division Zixibacteria bacterium]